MRFAQANTGSPEMIDIAKTAFGIRSTNAPNLGSGPQLHTKRYFLSILDRIA